jgi:hypothetical protein
VHYTAIHKEKSIKMQNFIKLFTIPYFYEAQHISGYTQPIIRSIKLHWQPLVFHKWKVVPDNVYQLHVQHPSTYEKPGAVSAVLGFL